MSARVELIQQDGVAVAVRIRAARATFPMLFFLVWLTGWTIGGVVAFRTFLHSIQSGKIEYFLAVWLIGWLFGWCWVSLMLLWSWTGAEVMTIRDGELSWKLNVLGYGPQKHWSLGAVHNLRVAGLFPTSIWSGRRQQQPWDRKQGTVAFDCNGAQERFGISLSESESQEVVAALSPYIPS